MGCVVHMTCPTDAGCGSNAECAGHKPTCGGNATTTWTNAPTIPVGTLVRDNHVTELQTAINNERTNIKRVSRGATTVTACGSNTPGAYPFTAGVTVGQIVKALHMNEVAAAINTTPFNVNGNTEGPGSPASNVSVGNLIRVGDVNTLRSLINVVETNCICNNYCSCNINCPCNNVLVCTCNVDVY